MVSGCGCFLSGYQRAWIRERVNGLLEFDEKAKAK